VAVLEQSASLTDVKEYVPAAFPKEKGDEAALLDIGVPSKV
jgi:hypothetical protein